MPTVKAVYRISDLGREHLQEHVTPVSDLNMGHISYLAILKASSRINADRKVLDGQVSSSATILLNGTVG